MKFSFADPAAISVNVCWNLWPGEPDAALAASVQAAGVLVPIDVEEQENGYVLRAGYRRLRAAMDQDRVPVRILPEDCFARRVMHYVASNAGQPLEPWRLVSLARVCMYDECADLEQILLPMLALNPKSRSWSLARAWVSLPEFWDGLLRKNALVLEAGPLLKRFGPQDQETLVPFFQTLMWGRNNSLAFLELSHELTKTFRISLEEIYGELGFFDVLHSNLSPKDTIQRILQALQHRRFPELTRLRRLMDESLASVRNKTGWAIRQPDNFESNALELSLRAQDRRDLVRGARELLFLADNIDWINTKRGREQT